MKRRFLASVLAACLLAGCTAQSTVNTVAEMQTEPTAQPQELTVAGLYDSTAAARAVQIYAEAQGVTLMNADSAEEADLVLLDAAPNDSGSWKNLAEDSLLAAAAEKAGRDTAQPVTALPIGKSLYAYWADRRMLTELLQSETAVDDLRAATWQEWWAFAAALTVWCDAPAEQTVTLNGNTYTLVGTRTEHLANLSDVFAPPQAGTNPGAYENIPALYTSSLLAAGATYNTETLNGALNGLDAALQLEYACTADYDAAQTDRENPDSGDYLEDGQALFCRAFLCDLVGGQNMALSEEQKENLVWLPVKTNLTDEDLYTSEFNLLGLTNYPVYATAGYFAIPASADDAGTKAAAAAILWLYYTEAGENALTETLDVVTPWGTASDQNTLGAMQVAQLGSGVLPGVNLSTSQSAAIFAAQYDTLYRDENGSFRTELWDTTTGNTWRSEVIAALAN